MRADELKPGLVLTGPLFPERVRVLVIKPLGASVKLVATGLQSDKTYQSVLSPTQLERLTAAPEEPYHLPGPGARAERGRSAAVGRPGLGHQ